jgi:uncharacterized protein (DUF736 family)
MTQYDNRGRGVLFKNDDKAEPKQPDYRGNLTLLDGTECWLDCWIQESKKNGRKFLSLKFKPKMAREHTGGAQNPPGQRDDGAPF